MANNRALLSVLGVNFIRTCTDKCGFLSVLGVKIGGDIIVYNNILYGRRVALNAPPADPPRKTDGPVRRSSKRQTALF